MLGAIPILMGRISVRRPLAQKAALVVHQTVQAGPVVLLHQEREQLRKTAGPEGGLQVVHLAAAAAGPVVQMAMEAQAV